jgi:lipoprotein-releasing system ATP-binding protein
MHNASLRLENIGKSFEHKGVTTSVLRSVTVTFAQGGSYAIMGVSGTGKSTLMHIIAGIEEPSSGHVFLNDQCISGSSHNNHTQHVADNFGLVFQQPYLIAELTVLENVALPGLIAGHSYAYGTNAADELVRAVGLDGKQHHKVATLSGGQQQRVALARALYHKPAFLIADEPTGSLDQTTADGMVNLIRSFCTQYGMGVIISTHDMRVASQMALRYRLHNGVVEQID